ncbi:MAG: hypothetical protein FJ255_06620 [Phycisphaerae bacterium]|nr:hypothetical protein [Phycisphaerae bacterium]
MFGKLALLILCVGLVACALLAMRQSRLQCAHELAQVQLRIARHDESLWRERVRIAQAVTPARVQEMATRLGPLRPLLAEPHQALVRNAPPGGGRRPAPPVDAQSAGRARADAARVRRHEP